MGTVRPITYSAPAFRLDLPSFPTRRSSDLHERGAVEHATRCAARRTSCGDCRRIGKIQLSSHAGQDSFSDRGAASSVGARSEEHTSELQSHSALVCRLLLEKKNAPIVRAGN